MKSNGLMIGDWVQPDSRSYPVQVESLDAGKINGMLDVSFDAIPLTPEILEKNGFEKLSRYSTPIYTFSDDDEYYALAIDEYTDSLWRIEYTNCEMNFVRILVSYVHELQRAMRCCGLYEPANSFTI